jgi:hypothetical protein
MIDDMQGLYSHASDVFRAGQVSGRDEFYRALQAVLGRISVKYESGAVSGPDEPLATRGFHVAEECCKAAREVKELFDKARHTV